MAQKCFDPKIYLAQTIFAQQNFMSNFGLCHSDLKSNFFGGTSLSIALALNPTLNFSRRRQYTTQCHSNPESNLEFLVGGGTLPNRDVAPTLNPTFNFGGRGVTQSQCHPDLKSIFNFFMGESGTSPGSLGRT